MKKILCFGDSNTWGQVAYVENQIAEPLRWTSILDNKLGDDYEVTSDGVCARIAGSYEDVKPLLNGKKDFEKIIKNHKCYEIIIIALGTNDLKKRYNRSSKMIVSDLSWYEDVVSKRCLDREGKSTKFIYVAPPNFNAEKDYFDDDEIVRAEVVELLMQKKDNVVSFNDLELSRDGVHISIGDHERHAQSIFEMISLMTQNEGI